MTINRQDMHKHGNNYSSHESLFLSISDNEPSSYHSEPNSAFPTPSTNLQNQESNLGTTIIEIETKQSFCKRILVVDDDPDITLTFKVGLDGYYYCDDKMHFEVYTYNNPAVALSEFKPNFYDLLLTDIYMPHMNGFELCQKILELDVNIRICFISAAEINIEALREIYPTLSLGCFIKKPVTIDYLVKRLSAELD
jgi:CheY-like chemotaxis protein